MSCHVTPVRERADTRENGASNGHVDPSHPLPSAPMPTPTVALAGNPNVGKSTLFNALTGARQHTGNWPGKTVERTSGRVTLQGRDHTVVDLPGIYSLSCYSVEEVIARDFLVRDRPSLVVAVVDAANLERNLSLVCQLIELEASVVIALTMADTAAARGLRVDPRALSDALGLPVIDIQGRQGRGLDALRRAIAAPPPPPAPPITYDPAIEAEIATLEAAIRRESRVEIRKSKASDGFMQAILQPAKPSLDSRLPTLDRWLALRLLENDPSVAAQLAAERRTALLDAAHAARSRLAAALGDDADILIADRRYAHIAAIAAASTTHTPLRRRLTSEAADRILTHRLLGIPIFLAFMWLVFAGTARFSTPLVDLLDGFMSGPLTAAVDALLALVGLGESWLRGLLVDGVIAGVGGVLAFIPVLALLYLSIAILEDSGYMARAAFVMDRAMRVMGLHGKSFLPLLLGFGCTVPAVYATRTLEHARDRRLTAFLTTFMSCSARLPVYMVFAAAFFGARAGTVLFALYLTGIVAALATGLLVRHTLHRRQPAQPFVLELPPYRVPHARTVARQVYDRTRSFVRRAGTVILASAILVWLLLATPRAPGLGGFNHVAPGDSVFGAASGAVAPLLAPAGFGSWEAAGALLTGIVAKEVVLGTLSQVYGAGEAGLGEALQLAFPPAAAIAFLLFILLYSPCVSALAAMRHEFGTRFAWTQALYTTALAWAVAVLAYQALRLLGVGL